MASNVVVNVLGNTKSLDNALDKSKSRASKWGSAMGKAAKVGGLAIAAGAVLAGKALFDMAKGAIEDEAAQKKLAAALKLNAGATDNQVASTEKWITAQGKALGVADDDLRPALGRLVTATKDVGEAQKLASTAMDISAGSGASLETVTKALAKAHNGSVAGLAKFGINVKNAAGETVSFEVAQKRLARSFKGQAETAANTLSGKIGRLKLALSEAGEEIGAKLIPVVTRLVNWFVVKGLPALQVFGGYLQDKLPPIFAKVSAVISSIFGSGGKGGISETITQAVDTIKSVFQDGVSIVQSLWKHFGKNIVSFLKGSFKSIIQVVKGAFQVIKGIFKVVSSILKGDWKGVWTGIKLILRGAANVVIGMVKNLWNTVKFAFKNAGVILKGIFRAMWDGLLALGRAGIGKVVDGVKALPGKVRDLGGKFLDAGKWIIGKLIDGFSAVTGLGGSIANAVKGALGNALNPILGSIEDAINNGIDLVNKIPGVDINHISIPELHNGGITTGPTLALIGDNPGGREAVIPLDKYALGGNTYVIHQHVAPTANLADAGRELIRAIEAFELAGGRRRAI